MRVARGGGRVRGSGMCGDRSTGSCHVCPAQVGGPQTSRSPGSTVCSMLVTRLSAPGTRTTRTGALTMPCPPCFSYDRRGWGQPWCPPVPRPHSSLLSSKNHIVPCVSLPWSLPSDSVPAPQAAPPPYPPPPAVSDPAYPGVGDSAPQLLQVLDEAAVCLHVGVLDRSTGSFSILFCWSLFVTLASQSEDNNVYTAS